MSDTISALDFGSWKNLSEIRDSKSDILMRILVCDGLEKSGVDKLRSASGVTVDEHSSIDGDELARIIGDYEGLVVRSKTRVTAELIERAANLRVVGRAGTGVDNIDVAAATRRGIVVMNAAAGNTSVVTPPPSA